MRPAVETTERIETTIARLEEEVQRRCNTIFFLGKDAIPFSIWKLSLRDHLAGGGGTWEIIDQYRKSDSCPWEQGNHGGRPGDVDSPTPARCDATSTACIIIQLELALVSDNGRMTPPLAVTDVSDNGRMHAHTPVRHRT